MTVFNWVAASALDVDGGGGEVEKFDDVLLVHCMVLSLVVGVTNEDREITLFHGLKSTPRIC